MARQTDTHYSAARVRRNLAQQEDWRLRRRSLLSLADWPEKKAWPLLQEALGDTVDEVRHAAVLVIGRMAVSVARNDLLKPRILGSPQPDLRRAAVEALGQIGDTRDIIPLTRMLTDEDWLVRNEARKVLCRAIEKLGERRDTAAIDTLIHLLFLENETIRPLVVRNLCRQGSRALPALREALGESSPAMLAGVIHVLGLLFDRSSLDRLIELADHDHRMVRCATAQALGHLGSTEAARKLARMLVRRQQDVIKAASDALARMGDDAVDPLLELLQHSTCPRVHVDCIRLLGRLRSPRAIPRLKLCLRSSWFRVRQATVEAMIDYGEVMLADLVPLLQVQAPTVDSLIRQYDREPTLEGRRSLVGVIGETGNHAAVPFLKDVRSRAADDAGLPLRRTVNRALFQLGCFAWERYCVLSVIGRIGTEGEIPFMLPSLSHPSYYVRNRAIRSLAHFSTPIVEKELARLAIQDPRYFVRRTALQTLGGLGGEAPIVLKAALGACKDSTAGVRAEAARVLGRQADHRAIAPLAKGLVDPVWSVREASELAIRNFGPAAAKAASKSLSDEREYIRYRVARLLGKLDNPMVAPALKRRLAKEEGNSRVHSAILESLRKLEAMEA